MNEFLQSLTHRLRSVKAALMPVAALPPPQPLYARIKVHKTAGLLPPKRNII